MYTAMHVYLIWESVTYMNKVQTETLTLPKPAN